MNREIIERMTNRFIGWKLPDDFSPDCGITFKKQHDFIHPKFGVQIYNPIGTNLFTVEQAKAMFEYCLADESEKALAPPSGYCIVPILDCDVMNCGNDGLISWIDSEDSRCAWCHNTPQSRYNQNKASKDKP